MATTLTLATPRRIFVTNAVASTLLTLLFYHGWLRWISTQHGMPAPGISESDVATTLAAVLVTVGTYPLILSFLYRKANRQQSMAAIAAPLGNLMATCFSATGIMGEYGHYIFWFGFVIGVGGAFAAIRARLEDAVGGPVLLAFLMLQITLITTLIP